MRLVLGFVPAFVCIGGMLLSMRMMSGHGRGAAAHDGGTAAGDQQVAELRDEVNRLRAELQTREQQPEASQP